MPATHAGRYPRTSVANWCGAVGVTPWDGRVLRARVGAHRPRRSVERVIRDPEGHDPGSFVRRPWRRTRGRRVTPAVAASTSKATYQAPRRDGDPVAPPLHHQRPTSRSRSAIAHAAPHAPVETSSASRARPGSGRDSSHTRSRRVQVREYCPATDRPAAPLPASEQPPRDAQVRRNRPKQRLDQVGQFGAAPSGGMWSSTTRSR